MNGKRGEGHELGRLKGEKMELVIYVFLSSYDMEFLILNIYASMFSFDL